MWSLICDNLSNILVLSLVLLAVGAAVTSMVLRKKRKTGAAVAAAPLAPMDKDVGNIPKAQGGASSTVDPRPHALPAGDWTAACRGGKWR